MALPRPARRVALALLGVSLGSLFASERAEPFPASPALAAEETEVEALFEVPFTRPDEGTALGRLFSDLDREGLAALEGLDARLEPLSSDERSKVAYAAGRFAGEAGDRALALRAYEEVAEDHVLAPWAERHLSVLRSRPPEGAQDGPAPTAEEALLDDARRALRAGRYERARRLARRAAVRSRGAFRCGARLVEAKALAKLKARADERALLERVIDGCDPGDAVTTARFRAAVSYAATGESERAIAHYDALADTAPTSTLADDALFRGARLAIERDDAEGAIARFRRVFDVHPGGDMASDAAFELGRLLHAEGRSGETLAVYRDAERLGLDTRAEDQRGRFTYHRARILLERGEREEAEDVFAGLIRRWPLTYYGFQAQARLAELDAPRLAALRDEIVLVEKRGSVPALPALSTAAFARAMALLETRSFDEAERELSACGLLGERSDARGRLVAAHLFCEAGDTHRALWLYRRNFDDLGELTLDAEGRRKLRLAYPKEFEAEIEKAARETGVPASLLRAVAREESSFVPHAVSRAGARGLVQLMPATARGLAEKLGVELRGPRAVFDPELNLRLGAHYLAFLERRFDRQIGLVPAAYNAGQGNVDRWLSSHPHERLDDFVEAIPYAETRRYTRRVLQSYGVYALLDEGRWIELPARLPGET